MNLLTQLLHLVGSGAVAYITARNLRDLQTRPDMLAGFQLAEAGAVPFLEKLAQRAAAEGDQWLAERLVRHAQDERRHSQIFAQALKQLNKQVIDFSAASKQPAAGQPVEGQPVESKPDESRRSPFFEAYFKGYSKQEMAPETIDWIVFLVSTHILELDASKDFARMAAALPDSDSASLNLKKGLLSIANDEKRHAAYLLEAMHRRLSYAEVITQVDRWRERKVEAMLAMVGGLINRGGKTPSLARDGVPLEMSEEHQDSAPESDNAATADSSADPLVA